MSKIHRDWLISEETISLPTTIDSSIESPASWWLYSHALQASNGMATPAPTALGVDLLLGNSMTRGSCQDASCCTTSRHSVFAGPSRGLEAREWGLVPSDGLSATLRRLGPLCGRLGGGRGVGSNSPDGGRLWCRGEKSDSPDRGLLQAGGEGEKECSGSHCVGPCAVGPCTGPSPMRE